MEVKIHNLVSRVFTTIVAKMATKIRTETYLSPENSFRRLIISINVAKLIIVVPLINHIRGLYSSNWAFFAFKTGKSMYSLSNDSINPQAKSS